MGIIAQHRARSQSPTVEQSVARDNALTVTTFKLSTFESALEAQEAEKRLMQERRSRFLSQQWTVGESDQHSPSKRAARRESVMVTNLKQRLSTFPGQKAHTRPKAAPVDEFDAGGGAAREGDAWTTAPPSPSGGGPVTPVVPAPAPAPALTPKSPAGSPAKSSRNPKKMKVGAGPGGGKAKHKNKHQAGDGQEVEGEDHGGAQGKVVHDKVYLSFQYYYYVCIKYRQDASMLEADLERISDFIGVQCKWKLPSRATDLVSDSFYEFRWRVNHIRRMHRTILANLDDLLLRDVEFAEFLGLHEPSMLEADKHLAMRYIREHEELFVMLREIEEKPLDLSRDALLAELLKPVVPPDLMEEYNNLYDSLCIFSSGTGCLKIDEMEHNENGIDFIEWSDYDLSGEGIVEFWPAFVGICCNEEHQNFFRILSIICNRFRERGDIMKRGSAVSAGAGRKSVVSTGSDAATDFIQEEEVRRRCYPVLPEQGVDLVARLYKRFELNDPGAMTLQSLEQQGYGYLVRALEFRCGIQSPETVITFADFLCLVTPDVYRLPTQYVQRARQRRGHAAGNLSLAVSSLKMTLKKTSQRPQRGERLVGLAREVVDKHGSAS